LALPSEDLLVSESNTNSQVAMSAKLLSADLANIHSGLLCGDPVLVVLAIVAPSNKQIELL